MERIKYFDGKDIQVIDLNTERHYQWTTDNQGLLLINGTDGYTTKTIKTTYFEIENVKNESEVSKKVTDDSEVS